MKTYPLYLNGEFITTPTSWDIVNPATAEKFARISVIDRPRLKQAIANAHAAFPAWRDLTARPRPHL